MKKTKEEIFKAHTEGYLKQNQGHEFYDIPMCVFLDAMEVYKNQEKDTPVKTAYYPVVIGSTKHPQLLAVQTKPELKYIFKGKEISIEDLVIKLESIK